MYATIFENKGVVYIMKFPDFRSSLLKKIPQQSPLFIETLNLHKKSKAIPDDDLCNKWIEDAHKKHEAFMKRLALHDKHMQERVDKFAKENPIIPIQNFEEIREDIKKHRLVDRLAFFAQGNIEEVKKKIIKEENVLLKQKMKAILKDVQAYQKYDKKTREINLILSKGPSILKEAEEILNKNGAVLKKTQN